VRKVWRRAARPAGGRDAARLAGHGARVRAVRGARRRGSCGACAAAASTACLRRLEQQRSVPIARAHFYPHADDAAFATSLQAALTRAALPAPQAAALDRRFFAGREVRADVYDEARFAAGEWRGS
jgi:hypothetical protein